MRNLAGYLVLSVLSVLVQQAAAIPRLLAEESHAAARPSNDLPPGRTDGSPGLIDNYFTSYWAKSRVTPAPTVDDAAFLRRASLAILGVIPTADATREFLQSDRSNKRRDAVDAMLVGSRYADYWGLRLRDWITELREVGGQGVNTLTLYRYTREAMAENRSWARIADDLVNSQGAMIYDGNANFGVNSSGQPNEMAEAATRLFLGTKISCAQCHDDPFHDPWTQKRYWELAAFFGRSKLVVMNERGPIFDNEFPNPGRSELSISTLPGGDAAIDGTGGEVRAIVDVEKGEVYLGSNKKNGQPALIPTPLGGEPLVEADKSTKTRREQFVEWMTGKENPRFAQAAVNRWFLELTGRGFVASADGFTPDGEVRHAALLDTLSEEFTRRDFDLKWLVRTIVGSRLFQLSAATGTAADGEEHWEIAPVRLLNGDQWHDSVLRASGRERQIWSLADAIAPRLDEERRKRMTNRREALAKARKVLADGGNQARLLAARLPGDDRASRPESEQKTERQSQAGQAKQSSDQERENLKRLEAGSKRYREIAEALRRSREAARSRLGPTGDALMQMNGQLIRESLTQTESPREFAALPAARERLDAVFLQVLTRLPSDAERKTFAEFVAESRSERIGDVMWALMQTSEFLTH